MTPKLPNNAATLTITNQAEADAMIPGFLAQEAELRVLIIEPMLGPINISPYLPYPAALCPRCVQRINADGYTQDGKQVVLSCSCGSEWQHPRFVGAEGLHGVILGGETGPHARPMHPDWVRSIRDQCAAEGVPFFFKGWGEWVAFGCDFTGGKGPAGWDGSIDSVKKIDGILMCRVGKRRSGRLLDGREHNELAGGVR